MLVEMRSQRDGARALEKEAAEAKLALETLSASVPETEARLNGRIKQLEAELGDARFDLEDERGRGLFLLAEMVDHLGVTTSPDGKGLSLEATMDSNA